MGDIPACLWQLHLRVSNICRVGSDSLSIVIVTSGLLQLYYLGELVKWELPLMFTSRCSGCVRNNAARTGSKIAAFHQCDAVEALCELTSVHMYCVYTLMKQ